MITDPPTSPPVRRDQIILGVALGIMDFVFHLFHSYYTFFFAAGLVATSRFLILRYKDQGLSSVTHDAWLWVRQSRPLFVYFLFGALLLNPLVWKTVRARSSAVDFAFMKDSRANELASSPMIEFNQFPIDERIRHLTKWLINSEGVAVSDINGDGYQDVFLLNSLKVRRGLFLFGGAAGSRSENFASVDAVLNDYKRYGLATSAVFVDLDRDGDLDLLITFIGGREGGLKVFRSSLAQTGRLDFEDISAESGLGDFSNSVALTVADFDQDGRLDIFLTTFGYDFLPGYPGSSQPFDIFNLPAAESARDERPTRFLNDSWYNAQTSAENRMYRQKEDGTFEKVASSVTGLSERHIALAVGSSDVNKDGWPDLYVANDSGPDDFYLNQGRMKFVRIAGTNSREIGHDYYKGMNVTFADLDRDGTNEIYVSNIHHPFVVEGSLLWKLKFDDAKNFVSADDEAARVGLLNENRWGWSAAAKDFNLDGRLDLIQANGMFDSSWEKESSCVDYFYLNEKLMRADARQFENANYWADTRSTCLFANERTRLSLQTDSGRFTDVAKDVGLTDGRVDRGVATVDFKNDGQLGFVTTSPYAPASFYRNVLKDAGKPRHWIGVELESNDPSCERSALNSFVEVRYGSEKQVAETFLTNGFSAQSDPRLVFGLRDYAGSVDIEVNWCGRRKTIETNLEPQKYHRLRLPKPSLTDAH